MRIKLLDRLRDGEATVGQLQEALDASQQNVSKHLGVLLQAGMVSRSKRGTSSVFAIADDSVFELCEQVCGGLRRQLSELDAILQGGQPA
jgi:DNA-binding transcriptional ArsR family regulator